MGASEGLTGTGVPAAWGKLWPAWARLPRQHSCPALPDPQHSQRLRRPQPQLLVEVQLETGRRQIPVTAADSLWDLRGHVSNLTGIPAHQQLLVICEERARSGSLGLMAKRLRRRWSARSDLRTSVMHHAGTMFLPEMFSRELSGRGWIGWVKSTHMWRSLQQAQLRAAARGAANAGLCGASVPVQVERLNGQTLVLDLPGQEPLGQVQALVEQQLGILTQQQRLLIIEQPGPGMLGLVANSILLHGLTGVKATVALASWVGCELVGKLRGTAYPLIVRRENGSFATVTVTGDTTLNQIQAMLAARDVQHLRPLSTAPTCPEGPVPALQEITFPLPPTLSQPQPKSLHSFMQMVSGRSWKSLHW